MLDLLDMFVIYMLMDCTYICICVIAVMLIDLLLFEVHDFFVSSLFIDLSSRS